MSKLYDDLIRDRVEMIKRFLSDLGNEQQEEEKWPDAELLGMEEEHAAWLEFYERERAHFAAYLDDPKNAPQGMQIYGVHYLHLADFYESLARRVPEDAIDNRKTAQEYRVDAQKYLYNPLDENIGSIDAIRTELQGLTAAIAGAETASKPLIARAIDAIFKRTGGTEN